MTKSGKDKSPQNTDALMVMTEGTREQMLKKVEIAAQPDNKTQNTGRRTPLFSHPG